MNSKAWYALIGAIVFGAVLWGLGQGLSHQASATLSDGLKLLLGLAFVGWLGWLFVTRRRSD